MPDPAKTDNSWIDFLFVAEGPAMNQINSFYKKGYENYLNAPKGQ